MADSLYPVFDIPTLESLDEEDAQFYKPAPQFDYALGDFVRDGANRVVLCDGREAYKEWVFKTVKTEHTTCLAYMGIGIDGERARAEPNREAVQAAYERTITEALHIHPCTERVADFEYEWIADTLSIRFIVWAKGWAAFDVELNVM